MNKESIMNDYKLLKEIAKQYVNNKQYHKALRTIFLSSSFMYSFNIIFTDKEVENMLKDIALNIAEDKNDSVFKINHDIVIYYDTFGLDNRGLSLIYIRALMNLGYKVLYITYKTRKGKAPIIETLLKQGGMPAIRYVENDKMEGVIKKLRDVILEFSPAKIFIYTTPDDVAGLAAISLFEGKCERFLINLTDHAFWLGKIAADYILEFRTVGINISLKYREIEKEKLIILPYYPIINKKYKFEGFPFELNGKKLIFSGGSLYKTLGSSKYYDIVRYILRQYPDTVFLYAGSGDDTELRKILNCTEFKSRAFHIAERKDLIEIMKRCFFYLSTYPLGGGLMTQYAVVAGKLPVTLQDREDDVTELLFYPERINCFHTNIDKFYQEIDRIFKDEQYKKSQETMLDGQVISEEEFTYELERALNYHTTKYTESAEIKDINRDNFFDIYIKACSRWKYNSLVVRKDTITLWEIFKNFPIQYITGATYKVWRKFRYNWK